MDIVECALCLDCRECQYYYECNLPSYEDDSDECEENKCGTKCELPIADCEQTIYVCESL